MSPTKYNKRIRRFTGSLMDGCQLFVDDFENVPKPKMLLNNSRNDH